MVVFCFSKRRCDSLVDSLASLDLTSADDKSDIQVHGADGNAHQNYVQTPS